MISNDEKMLKERLRFLFSVKKIKIADLADSKSEAVMLSRQLGDNDTTVPYRTLHRILYAYSDVSADWLIMGEGQMAKAEHVAPRIYTQHNEVHDNKAGGDITVGSGTQVVPSAQKFEELQARVAELEHDKRTLQAVVDAMTAGVRRK